MRPPDGFGPPLAHDHTVLHDEAADRWIRSGDSRCSPAHLERPHVQTLRKELIGGHGGCPIASNGIM
jgi:hypothetical protein